MCGLKLADLDSQWLAMEFHRINIELIVWARRWFEVLWFVVRWGDIIMVLYVCKYRIISRNMEPVWLQSTLPWAWVSASVPLGAHPACQRTPPMNEWMSLLAFSGCPLSWVNYWESLAPLHRLGSQHGTGTSPEAYLHLLLDSCRIQQTSWTSSISIPKNRTHLFPATG